MQPLVSIIIPTYNRAHLIGETLHSIIDQTYQNWECIVVDDGSTDITQKVLRNYVQKDNRFITLERPYEKEKGANACRNLGLNKAKGDYIIFFDSDDLMTPDHIYVKISEIIKSNSDYVITKTEFLNSQKKLAKNNYRFDVYPITAYNYVSQAVNWLTYDVCIKKALAKSIQFNESLQSGQEYNYFSKLVHKSINAKFIDKTVTLRRYHKESIRGKLNTEQKKIESSFKVKWLTYNDILTIADKKTRRMLIQKCIDLIYKSKRILTPNKFDFIRAVFREYRWRGLYFLLMFLNLKVTGKGYLLYKKLNTL